MNNVRCNLCGSDDYYIKYGSNITSILPSLQEYTSTNNRYGFFNRIVVCRHCGLVYVNPRDSDTKRLYGEIIDDDYLKSWQERARTFRAHIKILKKYNSGANLLDIGCYAGIFINEAKREGYNVTAIEPSKWAAEFAAKKTGIKVLCGGWEDFSLKEECYDIITLWDVIEHLEDPSACFKKIHRWLKKDGIVVITTHDISSFFARIMDRKYPWLMRFHLYHFTPKSLSALLVKNGLKPFFIKYYAKTFSIGYFLNHLNIKNRSEYLNNIHLSINTGDLFMLIAKK